MSNGTYDVKWGQGLADQISPEIKGEVGTILKDPPLIPIVPGKSNYQDVVQSFKVTPGPPLSIKPSSKLSPVKISLEFQLAQQQFDDVVLAGRLALRPAADLAFAVETIILHGARAVDIFNGRKLVIKDENSTLDEQEGLFQTAPQPIDVQRSIVNSILDGIRRLRDNFQHGPYCVVVSPDLHREAMEPELGMPRIAPILLQLRDNGFRFSEAAPDRTGVIFSLGGGAVDLPIPWDAHVECRTVEGDATFVIVEQFRLRINDPRAVVTLS